MIRRHMPSYEIIHEPNIMDTEEWKNRPLVCITGVTGYLGS